MDLPIEVALRGVATKALVSGLSWTDAQLKVDQEMAVEAVKCRHVNAHAQAKAAQQGSLSMQSPRVTRVGVSPGPLTSRADEVMARGPAQLGLLHSYGHSQGC